MWDLVRFLWCIVQYTAIGPSSSLLHKCRCSHPGMLCRIAILKNPQNSGENTCNAKTSPATLLELEFHCRYFPIDFMKFFIAAFFRTPLETASNTLQEPREEWVKQKGWLTETLHFLQFDHLKNQIFGNISLNNKKYFNICLALLKLFMCKLNQPISIATIKQLAWH